MAGLLLRLTGLVALACLLLAPSVSAQTSTTPYSVFNRALQVCSAATDPLGYVYVGYCSSPSILKYDPTLKAVAGFSAQSVAALATATAGLSNPLGVNQLAVSSSGTLWIGDEVNDHLIAVSNSTLPTAVTATIDTTALGGQFTFALAPNSDNVWVILPGQSQPVWLFSPQGAVLATLGNATTPYLNSYFVWGITTDSAGAVYLGGCSPASAFRYKAGVTTLLSSNTTCDIRKFTAAGAWLQTFAVATPLPVPPFFSSIAVDAAGTVYAADGRNAVTLKWAADGTQANLTGAYLPSLTIDPSGDLVAVGANRLSFVEAYAANLTVKATVAVTTTAFTGEISVAFSPDYLTVYSTSISGGPIAAFNATSGSFLGFLGAGVVSKPQSLCTDTAGNLYVTDMGLLALVKLSPNGTYLATFSDPALNFSFSTAASPAIIPSTGQVVVPDSFNHRLVVFSPNGSIARVVNASAFAAPGKLSDPSAVVVTADGSVVFTDEAAVIVLAPDLSFVRRFNLSARWQPIGLALAPDGRLFITDIINNVIWVAAIDGTQLGYVGTTQTDVFFTDCAYSPLQQLLYVGSLFGNDIITFPIAPLGVSSTNSASLCAIFYSLPGDVDYPWSVATSLTVTYNPALITNSQGTAVQVVFGSGTRTFTNRFGVSTTTAVTISLPGTAGADNLIYLNSAVPVDSNGLLLTLSSPVQLPGRGPSPLYSQLAFVNVSGYIGEGASTRADYLGQAFLSSIPGFLNLTIGASNVNALAASYATCRAPLTFTNGLRPPTQPSASNGALRFLYSYSVSDGLTYRVQAVLQLTAASAFATRTDALGNPYQVVTNVTGYRLYTYLATGQTVNSTVTGLSSAASPAADQRWYPYTLLSSAPGVYTMATAPYLDNFGLGLVLSPAVPVNGAAPGQGVQHNVTSVYVTTSLTQSLLAESYYTTLPDPQLQTQSYTLLA